VCVWGRDGEGEREGGIPQVWSQLLLIWDVLQEQLLNPQTAGNGVQPALPATITKTVLFIVAVLTRPPAKTRTTMYLNSSARLNRRSSSISVMVGFRWSLKAARVV
jgi:hypothetical protein